MATGAGSSLTKMKMRSSKSSNRVGWKLERLAISMSSDLSQIVVPTSPCSRCHHPAENWLCCELQGCPVQSIRQQAHAPSSSSRDWTLHSSQLLVQRWHNLYYICCFELIHCSIPELRYLLFSNFGSDLSVSCFSCDSYLDAQAIWQLRPSYEIAHLLKFGQRPAFRSIESSQLSYDSQNQGSTSGS